MSHFSNGGRRFWCCYIVEVMSSFNDPVDNACFEAKVRVGGGRPASAAVLSGSVGPLYIPLHVSVISSGPCRCRIIVAAVPDVLLRTAVAYISAQVPRPALTAVRGLKLYVGPVKYSPIKATVCNIYRDLPTEMKYIIHKYVIYYHQSIQSHNLYVCVTLEIAIYSYVGAGRPLWRPPSCAAMFSTAAQNGRVT